MTAPRSTTDLLGIDGVFNFRDLGGLPLPGGRTTATGRLYRADGLHRSPVDQRARLRDVPVERVIDLRTADEIDHEGRFELDGVDWAHAPILESLGDFLRATRSPSPPAGGGAPPADLLSLHYEHMVAANADALARALATVADAVEAGPTVFHCTAGKDRTGVMTALILTVAGVADADLAADYALSARAMTGMTDWYRRVESITPAERLAEMGVDPSLAPVVMGAEPATIETFLGRLRADHGGVEPYLSSIGADGSVARIAGVLRG